VSANVCPIVAAVNSTDQTACRSTNQSTYTRSYKHTITTADIAAVSFTVSAAD
jgi:hypothetical protein